MSLLLHHDAMVDKIDIVGSAALHMAVFRNRRDLARMLLASTSTVDLKDRVGLTALHISCMIDTVEHDFMEDLLKLGANARLTYPPKDRNVLMALAWSARSRQEQDRLGRLLKAYGADKTAEDSDGISVFLVAASAGSSAVIDLVF